MNTVFVCQVSGNTLVSLTTAPTGGSRNDGGYFVAVTQSIVHDGTTTAANSGSGG